MKRTTQKPVDVILPDSAKAALHAAAEAGRQRWEAAASIALGLLSDAQAEGVTVSKKQVYSAVANEIEAAATTVRQWCGVYEVVETVLDVYHLYGFEHWKHIITLAKRNARTIEEEADFWTSTEADYGGRPVTVDRLRAAIADPDAAQTLDAPKSVKTLDRAARAMNSHGKAVIGQGDAGVQPGQSKRESCFPP